MTVYWYKNFKGQQNKAAVGKICATLEGMFNKICKGCFEFSLKKGNSYDKEWNPYTIYSKFAEDLPGKAYTWWWNNKTDKNLWWFLLTWSCLF